MSTVVTKGRNSFTIGTEIRIMTDCTLVTCATNILLARFAGTEGSIAIDAKVNFVVGANLCDRFIKSSKTMTGVDLWSAENTG